MAHRLDVLMRARDVTNEEVAEKVECSPNYISGIRNGQRPGLKTGVALCRLFVGELTLQDLGIEIDPGMATPAGNDSDDGKAA